jgi:predicted Zn-dependent protease
VHCSEPTCAMSLATHIELVDAKAEQYCARCGLRLVQKFSQEGKV